MKTILWIALSVGLVLLGYALGYQSNASPLATGERHEGAHAHKSTMDAHQHEESSTRQQSQIWTCSMHPQIQLPKPGKCPLCGMDLIQLISTNQSNEEGPTLRMSKVALAMAEVETRKVERKPAAVRVNMVGKVEVDSTRIVDVTLLAEGEIRKLFVNYAGVPVKKGEHLAEIYSPEVYAAGQDLLVALQSASDNPALLKSASIKMELLGVPEDYIQHIKLKREVPETYILKSSVDAYVENLSGYQGMWIKKGQMLCRLVNMESLWVLLDAYESDLAWIRYGQHVSLRATALPGEKLEGIVSYIPPRLDEKTRTVKVRVNVENFHQQLKPGMFVSAELLADVTGTGRVTSSQLKGKWVSPMHPEIVKDGPGICDVCGMDLVPSEALGFQYDQEQVLPLLIPETAVLITGRRAIIYVRRPGEEAIFDGREILLGPKAGSYYVVLSGLEEGERVVVKGNFKIDSALQILAKPSMMSAKGGEALFQNDVEIKKVVLEDVVDDMNLKTSLAQYLEDYLKIQEALAQDNFSPLNDLAVAMEGELDYADYASLKGEALKMWNETEASSRAILKSLKNANNINTFRDEFKKLSKVSIALVRRIGHVFPQLQWMTCPMANADWMQRKTSLENPYYGTSMLSCGERKSELLANPKGK